MAYGLGSESRDLPAFVVLWSGISTYSLSSLWSNGVLPGECGSADAHLFPEPLSRLAPPKGVTPTDRRALDAIRRLNELRLDQLSVNQQGDPRLSRPSTPYRLAFRLPSAAGGGRLSRRVARRLLAAYGVDRDSARASEFAKHCLFAQGGSSNAACDSSIYSTGVGTINDIFRIFPSVVSMSTNRSPPCSPISRPAAYSTTHSSSGRRSSGVHLCAGSTDRARTRSPSACLSYLDGWHRRKDRFRTWRNRRFRLGTHRASVTTWTDVQATLLHLLGIDHTRLTVRH